LYLQTSEAICLYTLQYHIIIFYLTSAGCYLFRDMCPLTFCASFAPPVGKCNIVRDP